MVLVLDEISSLFTYKWIKQLMTELSQFTGNPSVLAIVCISSFLDLYLRVRLHTFCLSC